MEPQHPDWPPLSATAKARWTHRLALVTQLLAASDALLAAVDAEEEQSILMPHTVTTREHLRALVARYRQV